ncbi:SusD/RagB family nutrient-binding outer membrane lipoprotein [uncultured Maribacter sp.]|uniref:SusD/RagB family nutrient-binding outer membrane lipoprotein n=1 Tax=uncultured Maribacter sp. TaxID=431308 RepID=UPI00261F2704|nr:SusD/RagB family nutrient-binding outer membrane lipoprotein [uncultured Maribacter sp.]
MKKINIKFINKLSPLLFASLLIISCSDYLDVNTDPDSPSEAQITEEVILPSLTTQLSYELAGGYPARTSSLWTQQIADDGTSRSISTLFIDDTDINNTWQFGLYTGVLKDANNMIIKAEEKNNQQYIGIGKIIQAYALSILADFWGEAPWSEAFNEKITKPKFDTQESLYNSIDQLLNEANTSLTAAINSNANTNQDLLYGGDLSKWKKLANSLRARYALRLIYAKGTNQADLALAYAMDGFSSNDDDAGFAFEDKEDANNPWAQWEDKWTDIFINKFIVTMLSSNSDPRLNAYTLKQEDGNIIGAENGTEIQNSETSMVSNSKAEGELNTNDYFIKNTTNVDWMTYNELLFIVAEAYAHKSDYSNSEIFLKNAVKANLEKLNTNGVLTLSESDINTFINNITIPNNLEGAQKIIIEQKYIANFLQIEPYNDYRRTGYPDVPLPIVNYSPQIPERFPYPTNSILNNTENVPNIDYKSDKVWWNQK